MAEYPVGCQMPESVYCQASVEHLHGNFSVPYGDASACLETGSFLK